MINDNIILFLSNRGWNIDYGNDVYYKATPPEIFNFDDDFSILLPRNYEKIDFNNFITNTIDILSDLYDLNIDDLKDVQEFVVKDRFGSGSKNLGINLNNKEAKEFSHKLENPIFQEFIQQLRSGERVWFISIC